MPNLRAAAFAVFFSLTAIAGPPAGAQQPSSAEAKATRPVLDVVFVLDTTSSMSGLIEGAKAKIWSLASRMAAGKPSPKIRVGLVGFRDVGDSYVTKRFDLSENLDVVYENLKSFRAEGGGDTPEHVGRGLGEAVKLMSWTQESRAAKLIFLVGDAPPQHYQDGWDAKDWAKKAIAKGIVVNTIRCGTDAATQQEFVALAKLADGSYVSLEQGGGMVAVATPFDGELAKVNEKLATTTLIGGAAPAQAEWESKRESLKSLDPSVAADRISFGTNSGDGYVGGLKAGSVDLTKAPSKVKELKEAELPPEVRAIEAGKRQAYVEKVASDNAALQTRASELSKKRDAWLKDNKPKTINFEDEVMGSVANQASKAGVAY